MRKKENKVLLIGPFPKPITGNSLANQVLLEGLTKKKNFRLKKINTSTTFFDEKVGVFSLKKFLNTLRFNLQFYKIIQSDIVYITFGQTFLGILKYAFLILVAKVFKRRIIIHIHGNYLREEFKKLNKLKKSIAKFILGMADSGIVLSKSLVPNLTPFLKEENIHIVFNFVEDYLLKKTKDSIYGKDLNKLKIVYLSNLMLEKGVLDLLKALELMESQGIDFEAKFAGNIDRKSKNIINGYLSKIDNAKYLGVVKGEIKKELLLWGNVFVFPSYYKMEGQPISILEAMATGNVVLSTNHAGIPDIFLIKMDLL